MIWVPRYIIPVASFGIVVLAVLVLSCMRTDKHTHTQTDADKRYIFRRLSLAWVNIHCINFINFISSISWYIAYQIGETSTKYSNKAIHIEYDWRS